MRLIFSRVIMGTRGSLISIEGSHPAHQLEVNRPLRGPGPMTAFLADFIEQAVA